ncbi:MAG: amidohydrolase family protein [Acidobacteria bacterium]|nr:amidohydrolase family protein [Acidobacteriota bacterium]
MRRGKKAGVWLLGLALWGGVGRVKGQQVPPELLAVSYPDLVLYNGKVLTADDRFAIAQAVAVRDGKTLAVGNSELILQMAGPKTARIDLQGNTLTPGFIDVHSGQFWGAHRVSGPDWLGNFTEMRIDKLDDGLRAIKAHVDKARPGEWVFVNPYRTAAAYELTLQLLDSVAPNNPILVSLDNTTGWVNSRAFSLIPDDIKAGMGIYRDEKGQPTGRVSGWAYGVLTYEMLPWPDGPAFENMVQKQKAILQHLNRMGVTSIGYRMSGLAISVVRELYDRGELPMRIRISTEIGRLNPHMERYLKRVGNLMGMGNEWFKIGGATVGSFDPGPDTGGMMTRKPRQNIQAWEAFGPYGEHKLQLGVEPNSGKDWKEYSDYKNAILLGRYGWNVNDMHIQGDAGVELALEIFDKINKERPIKTKHFGMVHGLMRPADLIKRMAEYDLALSFNTGPMSGRGAEDLAKWYGADEVAGMSPVRNVIDAGMKPILEVTNGAGVQDAISLTGRGEPDRKIDYQLYLKAMQAHITRRHLTTGKAWGTNLKITREEALKMATVWASRFYGDEKIMGAIEPGKLADFVELGGDFLAVPEEKIGEIPILRVIVGGKVTYQKE